MLATLCQIWNSRPVIYQGEYSAAIPQRDKAPSIPATETLRVRRHRDDLLDPWVAAGSCRLWSVWFTEQQAATFRESEQALQTVEQLKHPFSPAVALSFANYPHQLACDVDGTRQIPHCASAIAKNRIISSGQAGSM